MYTKWTLLTAEDRQEHVRRIGLVDSEWNLMFGGDETVQYE